MTDTSVRALLALEHDDGPWLTEGRPGVLYQADVADRTFQTEGGPMTETIVGFAELPKNTVVTQHTDYDEFVECVRDKANYVHIKDDYTDGYHD